MDILADKYIIGLCQSLEDEVIADIARRVKKTGRYTETAEIMAKSMHELGYSPAKIQADVMRLIRADKQLQKEIAENTKAYKQEIQDIIDQMVKAAKKAGDTLIAEAGNMAWNNDLSMWQEQGVDLQKPNTMSQMISAFRKQTNEELRNLTRSMGFKNTVLGTTGVLNAYQREMDLALLKVASGTFSFDQAVNDCVHRLAQSGLRSVDYANGRSYQLDTAARMSVRTGMSQLSGKVMEANLASSGQDLVITSQHMGSRPEHAPWQNRVFSFSGKSKKYPDFHKETEYGSVTGLKGANCAHDFYPFWEGASVIPADIEEPAPVEFNGRTYDYYQATQKQRQMERNIRATKREIEAQKAIGGDTSELQAKFRKQSNEYRGFSNAVGLKPRDNRLRVISGRLNVNFREESLRTKSGGTYGVNWKVVKSKEYNKRFDNLSDNPKANELAVKRSRNALVNRSGKDTEELYAISLSTGKDVSSITNQHNSGGVKRTDKFTADVLRAEERGERVLFIHNHPQGLPPSIADLNELLNHNYAVGITVGHNGTIYYYTKPNRMVTQFDLNVAFRKNKKYTNNIAYEKAMEELAKQFEFEFRIL